jgi:hypothetical protein
MRTVRSSSERRTSSPAKAHHDARHTSLLQRRRGTSCRLHIFERIPEGYLVRKDSGANFALAVVKIKKEEPTEKN